MATNHACPCGAFPCHSPMPAVVFFMFETDNPAMTPRIWQIGALCRAIAAALDTRFNPVVVRGELSGFSRASSGHCYFSLKDESAQIRCAMFRRAASSLDFSPRDGVAFPEPRHDDMAAAHHPQAPRGRDTLDGFPHGDDPGAGGVDENLRAEFKILLASACSGARPANDRRGAARSQTDGARRYPHHVPARPGRSR